MALYRNTYRIESARLRSWDYASPGLYFVTICTKDRIPWFGAVTEGQMRLSEVGRLVNADWHRMGYIRHDVELDAWVVMPDHVHGIIQLIHCEPTVETPFRGVSHGCVPHSEAPETPRKGVSTTDSLAAWRPGVLGAIINQFKGACTKRIRASVDGDFAWQPRFHDTVIRSQSHLDNDRRYISENPMRWSIKHDLKR